LSEIFAFAVHKLRERVAAMQYKPTGKDPSVEKMIPVGDPVSP
jgi:hypothetical protein